MPEAPKRISVTWMPVARSELRAIDRTIATHILQCVGNYLLTRTGDLKKLKPPMNGFRLRCGEYRVFFDYRGKDRIEITSVRNRREAYR